MSQSNCVLAIRKKKKAVELYNGRKSSVSMWDMINNVLSIFSFHWVFSFNTISVKTTKNFYVSVCKYLSSFSELSGVSVDLLLITVLLLLNLLNLLGDRPLTRRVHHTWHPRARHRAAAISRGAHCWSLRGHTARWRHARSLHRKDGLFLNLKTYLTYILIEIFFFSIRRDLCTRLNIYS